MSELTVPTVDFSSLGQLPAIYKKGQDDALRQQTLASLGQGGQADANALLRSGDLSLAQLGINLRNRQEDQARQATSDARQAERDKVSDQHWSASFGLQKAANDRAGEDKYTVQKVENPDGTTSFFKYNGRTGDIQPIGAPAAPATPNNPFAVGPKLTPDQSKSATMVDRMSDANKTINKNENINDGFFGSMGGMAAAIPRVRDSAMFNAVATPERQQVIQAQRNFVNAILRVESGAAISQGEFDNAQRQYFPQPNDSKAVIDQKRQNRVTAMQGMAREAGPQYKPPADLISTKTRSPNVTSSGVKWSVE